MLRACVYVLYLFGQRWLCHPLWLQPRDFFFSLVEALNSSVGRTLVRTCHCRARVVVVCVTGFPARAAGTAGSKLSVKLEHAARNPPPHRWARPEQPALWTDVLAEMSRHIYIRNKLGEGIQAPIFQVLCVTYKLIGKKSLQSKFCFFVSLFNISE